MLILLIKKLKHKLKLILTRSFYKKDEFEQKIYDDNQFKNRKMETYIEFANIIYRLFKPKTFIDVGCANGFVSEALLNKGVEAYGIEGAKSAFKYMANQVKPRIYNLDLRIDFKHKNLGIFDIVNFTEVAEHIKSEHEKIMLNNVVSLINKYLVISWSNEWDSFKGTEKQKHYNPRSKRYVIKRLKKLGLRLEKILTKKFNDELRQSQQVYSHWKEKILVFSKDD